MRLNRAVDGDAAVRCIQHRDPPGTNNSGDPAGARYRPYVRTGSGLFEGGKPEHRDDARRWIQPDQHWRHAADSFESREGLSGNCTAAALANCPNLNQPVFAERLNIGNSQLSQTSVYETPPSTYINSQGNIRPSDYCKYSQLIASGFNSVLSLQQGQSAWMIEGVFPMPDLNPELPRHY